MKKLLITMIVACVAHGIVARSTEGVIVTGSSPSTEGVIVTAASSTQWVAPGQFKKLTKQAQIDFLNNNKNYELPYGILKNLDVEVQRVYNTRNTATSMP